MGKAQQRKISLRRIGRRGGRSNPSQRQKVQKARHGGASDRGAGKTTRTDVRRRQKQKGRMATSTTPANGRPQRNRPTPKSGQEGA